MKTFCSKCLAKDIKHEQLLGRQPKQLLIFIVNVILLNFLCLKFSFNCLKFYCVIVLFFRTMKLKSMMNFIWKHSFSNSLSRKSYKGKSFFFPNLFFKDNV